MNAPLQTEITEKALEQITRAEAEYQRAMALTVTNQGEYDLAGDYIAGLKNYKKALEAERKELVDPLNAHVKKINGKFRPHVDAIDRAIKQADSKMITYYREQERKRLQAEAAAAEKARKERERLEARAEKAAAKGQAEKAAALQEQAETAPVAPIQPVTSKQTSATTVVTTWSAQIYDKLSLIEAVAKGQISMETLDCNMAVLNGLARAQKDTLKIPGVRAVKSENIRAK